jgi:hypothetical protein
MFIRIRKIPCLTNYALFLTYGVLVVLRDLRLFVLDVCGFGMSLAALCWGMQDDDLFRYSAMCSTPFTFKCHLLIYSYLHTHTYEYMCANET